MPKDREREKVGPRIAGDGRANQFACDRLATVYDKLRKICITNVDREHVFFVANLPEPFFFKLGAAFPATRFLGVLCFDLELGLRS
jgi:hypothetical protein